MTQLHLCCIPVPIASWLATKHNPSQPHCNQSFQGVTHPLIAPLMVSGQWYSADMGSMATDRHARSKLQMLEHAAHISTTQTASHLRAQC